jgi:predicted membrane chloride channel (bestrophin family)
MRSARPPCVLYSDRIVGSCERLFSSPLPPTMSRHVVRCLQLWLLGFPFVLAGTMAPLTAALWVFATAYSLVGIDEVGVQVEQPFDILPMNKLCMIAMSNLEETFVRLSPRMQERLGCPDAEPCAAV